MQTTWYDASHRDGMVSLVRAVTATGGAVGWLDVPTEPEVGAWLESVAGERMAVAVQDGPDGDRVLASGLWRRNDNPVLQHTGRIWKVMAHPLARRLGAGRAVMHHLIADARAEGVELLTLECRGNNHGAQRMYAGLGFRVTGRLPDVIALGNDRFDQVLMHLDLRTGTQGLSRYGSRNEGPGAT